MTDPADERRARGLQLQAALPHPDRARSNGPPQRAERSEVAETVDALMDLEWPWGLLLILPAGLILLARRVRRWRRRR